MHPAPRPAVVFYFTLGMFRQPIPKNSWPLKKLLLMPIWKKIVTPSYSTLKYGSKSPSYIRRLILVSIIDNQSSHVWCTHLASSLGLSASSMAFVPTTLILRPSAPTTLTGTYSLSSFVGRVNPPNFCVNPQNI